MIKILNKSFKENVAWGVKPDKIDVDRVTKALYDARLYDFVKQFENNIDAVPFIGSTGASLGQKQRLAIARALYKEPEILIFDEATSALDNITQEYILDNLRQYYENRIVIMIAHRLSTIRKADEIVVLNQGKIVEIGNHESLMQKKQYYYQLVEERSA